MSTRFDCLHAKELQVSLQDIMPKGVDVRVEPRYVHGESKRAELIPSMFEVTFTRSGNPEKGLSSKERERVREIMFDDDTRESISNALESYRWQNIRISTRNRITDESPEYVWKIEHRPSEQSKGPPGSVRWG